MQEGGLLTLGIIFLKVICGVLPGLYIVAYSALLDNVLLLYGSTANHLIGGFASFIAVGLVTYFSGSLLSFLSSQLRLKLLGVLRLKHIDKIAKLEYAHIEKSESYDLINRVRSRTPDEFVAGFFSYLTMLELALNIISILVTVCSLSVWIGLLILVSCIPVAIVSLHSGKEEYEAFVAYQKVGRRIAEFETILTSPAYADERTIFGYGSWIIKRWASAYDDSTKIFLGVKKRSYTSVKITGGVVTISFLGMIFFMLLGVQHKSIPISVFIATTSQLLSMSSAISWTLSATIHSIAQCNAFLADYQRFIHLSEQELKADGISPNKISKIEFRDVCFCYPGNHENTLDHLNLTLSSDRIYAIVGENGAGKTTITKLLLGLYTNYTGQILIDGVDIREMNASSLFSVVFQDFAQYQTSLRDNIVFGNIHAMSDAQIESYLSMLDFNRKQLVDNLDTEMGYLTDNNTNLSLGEWQKICLIRALAHNGSFYILDEPTASLDPNAESKIYNDYLKIIKGKPALVITHRLGAARIADSIVVISDGYVKEQGTHNELIEQGGIYSQMYNTQKGWYI